MQRRASLEWPRSLGSAVAYRLLINVQSSSKSLLLRELAAKAASNLNLRLDQVAPDLLKHENLGLTRIGRGVAILHAQLPDLQRPYGLLAKLKQPIEFDTIDGQPVDIVFVLFLPANAEEGQLGGARALVARTLRASVTLGWLRRARDASELYSAMV